MTIEEKLKNAKEFFLTYYLTHGETFLIDNRTLEDNGLRGRTGGLDYTLKLRLIADGILVEEHRMYHASVSYEDPSQLFSYTVNGSELERYRSKNGFQKKTSTKIVTMYLNRDGDLWKEPKKKYCYPMGKDDLPHKIIRYLANRSDFQMTSEIANVLETSAGSIRKKIPELRSNIKKYLNLDGRKVVESRQSSGYQIGKGYKIKVLG